MDRRLISAYDRMIMPDGCSRRIETVLMEKTKPLKEQKYIVVLRQTSRWWTWARAAALVCMVAAALGGVIFFMDTGFAAKPSEIPSFTQPTAETMAPEIPQEDWRPDYFPYGAEGEAFLETMCRCMPQWDGYASLDDVFWTEFTVRLLNDFTYENPREQSSRVTTPAGDAVLIDGRISMKWEKLNAFIQETMGCELPEFNPSGEYQGLISYANETYSVEVTEFPKLRYEWLRCETAGSREVSYRIFRDADQVAVGEVTFYLEEAENELGFIILGRTTTLQVTEIENAEAETVAQAFGEAYFANDIEGAKSCLSHRDDSSLILNTFVQQAYSNGEESEAYKIFGVRVFASEGGAENLVAYVDYAMSQGKLYPSRSLVLDMVQTEDGWKVRNWTDKNPEGYDPDREEIFNVVNSYLWDYLNGESDWADRYMASEFAKPPVYEGKAENPQVQKITIYFDPLGETNDLGEPMADAYVEIRESEEALNPLALYLHFVKRDDGWKINSIGEG